MWQFAGQAKIFNGRFWRIIDVRVKASSIEVAMAKAARKAKAQAKELYKVRSIEAMSVHLERLGPVEKENPENGNEQSDKAA